MRFAFDGLPRDLAISREERRRLITRMNSLKTDGHPIWVAFVPAGMMLGAMAVWMPAIYLIADPWRWVVIAVAIVVQTVASLWIMPRALWPFRCRRMALAGCEVCPRCGYLQRDAPPDARLCSECGGKRITISPLESPADSIRSAHVTPQSPPPLR